MIEGALIFLGAILLDRLILMRLPHRRKPRSLEPLCGCGHHASYHDEKGTCAHATVREWWTGPSYDRKLQRENRLCTCKRYVLRDDIFAALNP